MLAQQELERQPIGGRGRRRKKWWSSRREGTDRGEERRGEERRRPRLARNLLLAGERETSCRPQSPTT